MYTVKTAFRCGVVVGSVRPISNPFTNRRIIAQATKKSDGIDFSTVVVGLPALMASFLRAGAAHAINREYGFVEGQILSLTHPAIMFFLFGASIYAGYLGLQWRRTRELAEEIKTLKAQRPKVPVGADGEPIQAPETPIDTQIAALESVRQFLKPVTNKCSSLWKMDWFKMYCMCRSVRS